MSSKACPKCGEIIPSYFYYHSCGWTEQGNSETNNVGSESKVMSPRLSIEFLDNDSVELDSQNMSQFLAHAEHVGAIGSPSSTSEIVMDILGTAANRKLVGELSLFSYLQDELNHYALGQVTEVQLKNHWLEDPTIRSLTRQRGQVNPISEQQDTHQGAMTISAVFSDNQGEYEPSLLGTVPPTGTSINVVSDDMLSALLKKHMNQIFYLGNVFGSKVKLPLWFKHFDKGTDGAGEAYHIGIFGKTGSGKSVLAKRILMAYAKHTSMPLIIVDPQGEFAKDFTHSPDDGFMVPLKELCSALGRKIIVKNIKEIRMGSWDIFSEILMQSRFFDQLTIAHPNNKENAVFEIETKAKKTNNITLKTLIEKTALETILNHLNESQTQERIYPSAGPRQRMKKALDDILSTQENIDEFYNSFWKPVCSLFAEDYSKKSIDSILISAFSGTNPAPIIVLNLSSQEIEQEVFWNDTVQAMVIKNFLQIINRCAETAYKENRFLNTLVVIDEAHRIAPKENTSDKLDQVRAVLIDSVRTTRKYGLGWMFISQTLSSLHREIINQMRIFYFGFGLSMGMEYSALREIAGGDKNSLKLYQSFRDPQSAFDSKSKQYSFMTVGPVSPLSFSGSPLFFSSFNDNETFLNANKMRLVK